ncbi:MAG: RidA family protein [Candidatus Gastranaerophilales bacterium]|nr:RidA family protein [Candidatus Gastranaerophilales bacterium]
MNKIISTEKAPKAIGPYSQAYLCGNTLYCSGQIAINPKTNEFIGGNIEEQTCRILKNIDGLLSAAGYTYDDVVKTTCFLSNMNDFAVFNSIYEKAFKSKPARSCVAVKELPKSALVEIEVIAVK